MKFLVFAASHRKQSLNRKLAYIAASHLALCDHTVDFAEYAEFDLPLYNDEDAGIAVPDAVKKTGRRFEEADGIVISSPEYNWSYPGSLKNLIDWLSRLTPLPTQNKTVFLMSASTSMRGGILGLSHLEAPLKSLQLHVFPKMFPLGDAVHAFATDTALADARKQTALIGMLDEYRLFTQKLSHTP
jgi:chromate reductase, NAD(P)H dehydrogenase (quinone)